MYNICVDDAVAGEPLVARPAVTEEEATMLEAVLEHVRGTEDFISASEELDELSGRLLGQILIIVRKYEAGHLEPI